jgi:hypothetical protein
LMGVVSACVGQEARGRRSRRRRRRNTARHNPSAKTHWSRTPTSWQLIPCVETIGVCVS